MLTAIHHILLTQGSSNAVTYNAPEFDAANAVDAKGSLDLTLSVGGMTTIVAKAGGQDRNPVPVEFAWESDSDAVTVDNGMIEAVAPTTGAEITLSVVGRGIEIKMTVSVLEVIKRIEFAAGQATSYVLPVGGSIDLMTPVAFDEVEGGDQIAGAELLISWVSSAPDIVSVDGNTITAESIGKAEITAQGQGVTAKAKIEVTVAGGTGVIRYVMNPFPSNPVDRTRALTLPVDDDPATEGVDESVARAVEPNTNIVFLIKVSEVGHDGRLSNNDGSVTATVRSQNPDVIAIPEDAAAFETSTDELTVTIQTGETWIVGHGTAYLVVSIPGAEDLPLAPIMINKPSS